MKISEKMTCWPARPSQNIFEEDLLYRISAKELSISGFGRPGSPQSHVDPGRATIELAVNEAFFLKEEILIKIQ
jgi:hypothetical protein